MGVVIEPDCSQQYVASVACDRGATVLHKLVQRNTLVKAVSADAFVTCDGCRCVTMPIVKKARHVSCAMWRCQAMLTQHAAMC